MTKAPEKVTPLRPAAESRRSQRRDGEAAPDTLHDAGPAGYLTAFGWDQATPEARAERLLVAAERNVANAANALNAGMCGSHEERMGALLFIAEGLRREAKLIGRARKVLNEAVWRGRAARAD